MLTWVEISKSSLIFNIRQIRKAIGPNVKLLSVVKANAYGHGVAEVTKIIQPQTDWFGVASLAEALKLRKLNVKKPILVLSFYELEKNAIKTAIKKNIALVVYSLNQVKTIEKVAGSLGQKANVHLKVDSGTSRLGVMPNQIPEFLKRVKKCKNLRLTGIFSHLADSEENVAYTKKQLAVFEQIRRLCLNYRPPLIQHIACSAASVLYPSSRYDLVRTGIMLYGLHPSKKTNHAPNARDYVGRHIRLKPVLTWKTKIIQIKELPPHTYVGYGLSFKTRKRTKLAVLPVGYADGYDRKLSNNGQVLIKGKRARVIGRVCMNMMMVDASGIAAREGDEVVLLGSQKQAVVSAEELAEKIGTINYEVVTRINWELPRVVISGK